MVCYAYDCLVSGLCPVYSIQETYTAGVVADYFFFFGGGGACREYLMVDNVQKLSNHNIGGSSQV
jgi:hypothetical protein